MRINPKKYVCIIVLSALGLPAPAMSQVSGGMNAGFDPLKEIIPGADFRFILDYRSKVIEAEGRGASRAAGEDMAAKRIHALEEARRVAYLRLAESIGGIRLEGKSTLAGTFLRRSEFVSSVNEFIRGASVVSETASFLDDGSAVARVVLRLFLYGEKGLTGTLWGNGQSPPPPLRVAGESPDGQGAISGVVLKVRGASVLLGLAPRLCLPDRTPLYSREEAESSWLCRWGAVEYVTDIRSAAERIGRNPLIVSVSAPPDSPDLILDPAHVQEIMATPRSVWSECRVVVLVP